MSDSSITVVMLGAGAMGAYISYLCAKSGYTTRLVDTSPESIARARSRHREWAQKDFDEASVQEAVLRRVTSSPTLEEAVKDAGLVIEALPENLDLKRRTFAQLDALCPPQVILASNSSSLRMSRIEQGVVRRERVCNLHFFLPPLMAVEIMGGSATSLQVIERMRAFGRSLGLRPFVLVKESTGFLYNRIWRAVKREVLQEVASGVARPEDIDRIVMMAWGWTMGPFAWMDQVGLDVIRDIELVYFGESGDPKDKPPAFLEQMIVRGELGVKSGKGFYSYPNPAYERPGWLEGTGGLEPKRAVRGDFAGSWRLISFEASSAGQTSYPFGKDACGSLIYTPGGQMSVVLSKPGRTPFASPDLLQGRAEDKAAAFDSCLSYFGSFVVKEDAVIHRIEHCTFPNWIGTEQTRFFHVENNRLTLETPPMIVGGKETVSRLVWQKMPPTGQ